MKIAFILGIGWITACLIFLWINYHIHERGKGTYSHVSTLEIADEKKGKISTEKLGRENDGLANAVT